MSVSSISNLQEWYASQCNGDWEHTFGVTISTMDNPGWGLTIDLTGTSLENIPFNEYRVNLDAQRAFQEDMSPEDIAFYEHMFDSTAPELEWMICVKRESTKQYAANGGPLMLDQMIQKFLDWADTVSSN